MAILPRHDFITSCIGHLENIGSLITVIQIFQMLMCFIIQYQKTILVHVIIAATAKSLQSFPTLCDPIDSSPPGSPIPAILQTRILEWVAISFSNA